jgi:predicted tellurium resistance membrane protein TerC
VIVRWPILAVVLLLFLLYIGFRILVTGLFNLIADRFK